mgnify:FL=1
MYYYIHFNQDAESIKRAQKAMTDLQEQLEDMQRILDYLNKENDSKTKEIQVTNLYGLSHNNLCVLLSTHGANRLHPFSVIIDIRSQCL